MTPAQYLQARFRAEAECKRKIRALDEAWQLIHPNTPPPQTIESHDDAVAHVRGAWRQLARQVVWDWGEDDPFSVRDIEQGIMQKSPSISVERVSVSLFLKQLADAGELTILEQGSGRRPTVYIRPSKTE